MHANVQTNTNFKHLHGFSRRETRNNHVKSNTKRSVQRDYMFIEIDCFLTTNSSTYCLYFEISIIYISCRGLMINNLLSIFFCYIKMKQVITQKSSQGMIKESIHVEVLQAKMNGRIKHYEHLLFG